MSYEHLETYLNDHLAGAMAAIDLLERLETRTRIAGSLAGLRTEIEADRQELKTLIARLHMNESRTRKIGSWFAEKLAYLLSVHCDDSEWTTKAKRILEETGAEDVSSTGEASADYGGE